MGLGRSENLGQSQRGRILILGGMIFVFFLIILVKLYNLQIVNQRIYSRRAREVSQRSSTIPARRGRIYDVNYDFPLVDNEDSFSLSIIPASTAPIGPNAVLDAIEGQLERRIDREGILNKIPQQWEDSYNPIEIATGISYQEMIPLAESNHLFPGLTWDRRPSRFYNYAGSISHILGYVGSITREELQVLYNQGYQGVSIIGKSGIERIYDSLLKGSDGYLLRTVDVRGRNLTDSVVHPPKNGYDVILTVDRHIQELAEKALGSRKGSVIVLRPSTGEILAMVSYPSYNPNLFFEEGENSFSSLSLNRDNPFLNRAIQSSYAPASTFKVLMTFALLAEGWNPNREIHCDGAMILGDREFKCHKKNGHGYLNLHEGLAESCNIYFGTAGMELLGIERIEYYSQLLGLGQTSDIDLMGETTGLIPNPQWKEDLYNTPWTGGDTLNATVGQGYVSVTPLQMANLVAMLVNNGKLYKPHILHQAIDSQTGEVALELGPVLIRDISDEIPENVFTETKEAMREVVLSGTAEVAIMNNVVEIAGKTGTGEIGSEENFHAWFISYGPYEVENPDERVVVVAQVEAYNEEWDWWAIKAADMIYQGIFANQTYEEVVQSMRERWVWYVRDIPREDTIDP